MLRYGFGPADHGSPRGSKRVTIGACLPDEETASWIGLQVLRVHRHIANEEDRLAGRIEREGHQRAEGKTRMLAGERRQRADRRQCDEGADTLSMTWLRELRGNGPGGCMLTWRGGFLHRHSSVPL